MLNVVFGATRLGCGREGNEIGNIKSAKNDSIVAFSSKCVFLDLVRYGMGNLRLLLMKLRLDIT